MAESTVALPLTLEGVASGFNQLLKDEKARERARAELLTFLDDWVQFRHIEVEVQTQSKFDLDRQHYFEVEVPKDPSLTEREPDRTADGLYWEDYIRLEKDPSSVGHRNGTFLANAVSQCSAWAPAEFCERFHNAPTIPLPPNATDRDYSDEEMIAALAVVHDALGCRPLILTVLEKEKLGAGQGAVLKGWVRRVENAIESGDSGAWGVSLMGMMDGVTAFLRTGRKVPQGDRGERQKRAEPSNKSDQRKRSPTVNDRMKAEMAADLEGVKGLTAQQWADRLGCAKSTVVDTMTWKNLALLRQQAKAEHRMDRRRR